MKIGQLVRMNKSSMFFGLGGNPTSTEILGEVIGFGLCYPNKVEWSDGTINYYPDKDLVTVPSTTDTMTVIIAGTSIGGSSYLNRIIALITTATAKGYPVVVVTVTKGKASHLVVDAVNKAISTLDSVLALHGASRKVLIKVSTEV